MRARAHVWLRVPRSVTASAILGLGMLSACSGSETARDDETGGANATAGASAAGVGGAGTAGTGKGGSAGTSAAGDAGTSGAGTGGTAAGTSGEAGAGATAGGTNGGGTNGGGTNGGGAGGQATIDCRADGDDTTTLVFVNRCAASVSFRGSDIDGGELPPGAFVCVDIGTATEVLSAKRYWGFSGEDPGGEHHTLAEFTFNTDFNDFDWYNISHVDAFNLPMQIVPAARPDCETLTCAEDFLLNCPDVGRYEDSAGNLTSCVSPNRDDGESTVALYFEACDDAYAWSGDDANGDDPSPVRACAGEDWDIVFCPEGDP
jgi:hypothetical protein